MSIPTSFTLTWDPVAQTWKTSIAPDVSLAPAANTAPGMGMGPASAAFMASLMAPIQTTNDITAAVVPSVMCQPQCSVPPRRPNCGCGDWS